MTEANREDLRRRARLQQGIGSLLVFFGLAIIMSGFRLGTVTPGSDGRLHFDGLARVWSLFSGGLPLLGGVLIVVGRVREGQMPPETPGKTPTR